jgi:hypothetical protein
MSGIEVRTRPSREYSDRPVQLSNQRTPLGLPPNETALNSVQLKGDLDLILNPTFTPRYAFRRLPNPSESVPTAPRKVF